MYIETEKNQLYRSQVKSNTCLELLSVYTIVFLSIVCKRFTSVCWRQYRYYLLSLPNKVWETYCFCSISYYYYSSSPLSPFFPRTMNLSTADLRNYWTEFHETLWSYRYMFLVGPKVFSFVVKGVKVIFWGVQRGWESWNLVH